MTVSKKRAASTKDLSQQPSFQQLVGQSVSESYPPLTAKKLENFVVKNGELSFYYGGAGISDTSLKTFQKLSDEAHLISRYKELLAGEKLNITENRSVLHHLTRKQGDHDYAKTFKAIEKFSNQIRQGDIKSSQGHTYQRVVQIGIGGSYLGPKACIDAISPWAHANNISTLDCHFLSNIDPSEFSNIHPSWFGDTLWIVVSKSGSTLETAQNVKLLKALASAHQANIEQDTVLVTQKGSKLEKNTPHKAAFYMDEAIGGRFSTTSAVGMLATSLIFGPDVAASVLEGAQLQDGAAEEPNVQNNLALLHALISVYYRNINGFSTKAIIPYAQNLEAFILHLQQADCESNGKHVNVNGQLLPYQTGPLIFGSPGTNSQHSYFQKLHQGTDIIPIEFLGFDNPALSSSDKDVRHLINENHRLLNENLASQFTALVQGHFADDKRKHFDGKRPCTVLKAPQLTPSVFGQLLALYENSIMFQGFLWNLNSFDQEGVELGKTLAKQLQEKRMSENQTTPQAQKKTDAIASVHDVYNLIF